MNLKSRYGDTWELEETEGGYLWKSIPNYTRFGLFPDTNEDICFVDPPGGPFLEIGSEIFPGEIITEILSDKDKFEGIIIKTHKKGE